MRHRIAWVAAVALGVTAIASASSSPIPRVEQQRIVAEFGKTYLPRYVPPGYIFVGWASKPGSASVYGKFLDLSFGRHGSQLEWVVGDARDPDYYGYDACSRRPFNARIFYVAGRRIVFQSGNHGDTATLCLPVSSFGVRTAVYAWNDHTLSPRALSSLVASAHLVG